MKTTWSFCRRQSEGCGFTVSPVKPQEFTSRQSLCLCGEQIVIAFFFVTFLLFPCRSSAQTRIEVTPMVSVSETYDDNLDLENTNKKSDFITTVTPGADLSVQSEKTNLALRYFPSFVRYADYDQYNSTRHSAGLNLGQSLTEYLKFDLTDSYLKSEDPLEDTLDLQGRRQTRNQYWVNTARASVAYRFGAENRATVGYGNEYRKNKEVTLDNSEIQTPFASLAYWFDVKNGAELNYTYTDAHFWTDGPLPADDDYTGHSAGLRYIRRFTPQTRGYAGYTYTTRNFEGLEEDYVVHNGHVGAEHAFSPEYSVSGSVGYFIRVNDFSDNQSGPTFTASLTRNFSRGSIVVGGDGGWGEQYLTRGAGQQTGFTQYYSGFVRGTYQILEPLSAYAGALYRHDKEDSDLKSQLLRGNAGLRWSFWRWYALSLDYTYSNRNGDNDPDDYTSNRVMLLFSVVKPYRW